MTQTKIINRPFNSPFNGILNSLLADMERNFGGTSNQHHKVPVNIFETADAYHLELLAPGRNKQDFSLSLEDGYLTISYTMPEISDNNVQFIHQEFTLPSFSRRFFLDEKVNTDNIQAKYENGILKVLLPKKVEAQPIQKQINIQ